MSDENTDAVGFQEWWKINKGGGNAAREKAREVWIAATAIAKGRGDDYHYWYTKNRPDYVVGGEFYFNSPEQEEILRRKWNGGLR